VRSKADGKASLIWHTAPKTKNKEETKKPGSSEETVQLIVHEGSPREQKLNYGKGFENGNERQRKYNRLDK